MGPMDQCPMDMPDDESFDRDDEVEKRRAEAADELGDVLINLLKDQAGDRRLELRSIYGTVQVVAVTTDAEYCEVIAARHSHWEVMLDLTTARAECLVVPVPTADSQALHEAASSALGRRVVAIVAPPPAEDYGRNDGSLVALITTPVDTPEAFIAVATCGQSHGIPWDVWPPAFLLAKPY